MLIQRMDPPVKPEDDGVIKFALDSPFLLLHFTSYADSTDSDRFRARFQ